VRWFQQRKQQRDVLIAWLTRQLRHKSNHIRRLRRQIRARSVNLQRVNQNIAFLIGHVDKALQSASEIDSTTSPANFRDPPFSRWCDPRTKQYWKEMLLWRQQVCDSFPPAWSIVLGSLSLLSGALIKSQFHEVSSVVSGALLDGRQIRQLIDL
jgi:hypothetical protein